MNVKAPGIVRPFLWFAVPKTKTPEFSGDGKASVLGGDMGVDADEQVLRIQYARLESEIFAVLDAKAESKGIVFRIDRDVAVPVFSDQRQSNRFGPGFFDSLLCRHYQNSFFDSFPTIVTQKGKGMQGSGGGDRPKPAAGLFP